MKVKSPTVSWNWNRFFFLSFVVLSASNLLQGMAERFDWWGDPTEPHFSHGSSALVWIALAALYRRTEKSVIAPKESNDV